MLELSFWICVALAGYSYFIYPAVLWILVRWLPREGHSHDALAAAVRLSLIITAHNEQERIRAKIVNALAIDYGDLEIIIASDCSTDGTDDIVREYAGKGVRLVRAAQRLGKENAQWCAIREASGDVLVFSDVATEILPDALSRMAAHFSRADVGAVSSEDRFVSRDGAVVGEGAYVRYEMWLRRMESRLAGLVGLSGSFFAVRKTVCARWDIQSPSDFNSALNCARMGLRAIAAEDVLGYYRDLQDPSREHQRKVRTVVRGLTAISRHMEVLNVWRYPVFAWQVWSHKVMRWLVPWILLFVLGANLLLIYHRWVYVPILLMQVVFYGLAALGHLNTRLRQRTLVRLIYFFVQANAAILEAWSRFLRGSRMTTWQPSTR